MISNQQIGLGLIAAGMLGLYLPIAYSGWVLAIGILAIFSEVG